MILFYSYSLSPSDLFNSIPTAHLARFAARQKAFGGSEFFPVGVALSPQVGHELLVHFHFFSEL